MLALAAVLRLAALSGVPTNPYYDAAVRSMGTSWAAFFSGAFEPGRRVAIDKPPIDLWLQVASTRLLGFGPVGLLVPEALGGIALVGALMWLLRLLFGRRAALAGGLALAVLPSAVVVARSDTMDAVMAALVTAGAALVAHAARSGRLRPLLAAGALLGLAFDVKLAEALLGVAAAIVLWLATGPRGARLRLAGLGLGGAAFAVTALAWLVAITISPLHPRPWALGSSDGSPWQAAFVYNGVDRLLPSHSTAAGAAPTAPAPRATAREAAAIARRAREHSAALARRPGAAGPLRLLSTHAHLLTWIGIEAVAALAALAAALALGAHRRLDRIGRGGLLALGFWLVAGVALYSVMPGLRPRYLACLDPAVAGGLGAGVALVARRARSAAPAALGAVLVVPLVTSVVAVAHGTQDAGRTRRDAPVARRRAVGVPARQRRRRAGRGRGQRAGEGRAAHRPRRPPGADPVRRPGPSARHARAAGGRGGRRAGALRPDRRRVHSGQRERAHRLPAGHALGAQARRRRQPRRRPAASRPALRAHPTGGRGGSERKNSHVREVAAKGAGGGFVDGPPGQPWAAPSSRTCSTRVPCAQSRQAISVTPVAGTIRSARP